MAKFISYPFHINMCADLKLHSVSSRVIEPVSVFNLCKLRRMFKATYCTINYIMKHTDIVHVCENVNLTIDYFPLHSVGKVKAKLRRGKHPLCG